MYTVINAKLYTSSCCFLQHKHTSTDCQIKDNQTRSVPFGSNEKKNMATFTGASHSVVNNPHKQLHHQLLTFRVEYMLLWVQFVGVCCPRRRAVKLVCRDCCRLSEFHMKRFDQLVSMWVSL
jgi:hypothetical protein